MDQKNQLSEEQWNAVISNDKSYDGQFFYAVKTTGIFCRPSCKSRPPNKENILIFQTADQALVGHFRPCKRCKPTGQRLPDHEWVAIVTDYIDTNYAEPLTLEILAEICHGSPYHLHRTFKRIKEITPVEYIQNIRIDKAKEYLVQTNKAIAEVGQRIGMNNTPYFITLFKKVTGFTPLNYRQVNNNHSEVEHHEGRI
ncbi:bifunctional transcriptional activator/DNA repair enzyme AdaA [Paenibacillus sp. FA6]|uniref:bifunctional transcriptional activator/DNA repair enzyme AdaA n=1 Tax=Paenibacillus sp. FA6 TaxID=3413029 RepID=UPI003F658C9D